MSPLALLIATFHQRPACLRNAQTSLSVRKGTSHSAREGTSDSSPTINRGGGGSRSRAGGAKTRLRRKVLRFGFLGTVLRFSGPPPFCPWTSMEGSWTSFRRSWTPLRGRWTSIERSGASLREPWTSFPGPWTSLAAPGTSFKRPGASLEGGGTLFLRAGTPLEGSWTSMEHPGTRRRAAGGLLRSGLESTAPGTPSAPSRRAPLPLMHNLGLSAKHPLVPGSSV